MKTLVICISSVLIINTFAGPPHRRGGKGDRAERVGEHAAMREEQLLDHRDTHKWKSDPAAKDQRPSNLGEYHNRTFQRIVRLLHHGALAEEDGLKFKKQHTEITVKGKEMRAEGELSEEQRSELRGDLDALNDAINASLLDAEKASARTPILNHMQHRFEEQIEFGERSGRLSKGEASRLKREVAKLGKLEERLKDGNGLKTSERERLFEEAAELRREIMKELKD